MVNSQWSMVNEKEGARPRTFVCFLIRCCQLVARSFNRAMFLCSAINKRSRLAVVRYSPIRKETRCGRSPDRATF